MKVVFIPKAGKIRHSSAKDYRPISLSSFLLKVLERVIEYEIRSKFNDNMISKSQHAYVKGRSVDTALHIVVKEAEKAIHHNQFALIAFLDIEGAFNNVTTAAIMRALETLNVRGCVTSWIVNMLGTRMITSTIGNNSSTIIVNRGTPQGGVLSPLLWLMVVNDILLKFESHHIKAVAYADDVAIIMPGLFAQVAYEMNKALKILKDWAVSCGLNIIQRLSLFFSQKGILRPT